MLDLTDDLNWNSHYGGNGLAGQFWQMESALSSARARANVILAVKCDTNSNNNFYLNRIKSKASTAYLAYGAVYTSAFQNPSPSK